MEWKIEDKNCWICGSVENITEHHTLPKHWKLRHNIIVPICQKCHNRLNAEDLAGMLQFAFKIEQELGRQLSLWGALRVNLEKYVSSQQIILDAFKKSNDEKLKP
ncbi:MAG: HNH endonuclease signature motif containing protein [Nanoarchaeota archaeon]